MYVVPRLGCPYGEKLCPRSWVPAEGGTQTEGTVSPSTDRPRPVNKIFFSYWDLKVSGKFSFSLQPMCVDVARVRADEACDRLQTKTEHYNMISNL